MQFNSKHHVASRVGGNPESKLRFQTHAMSNLVDEEFNNAELFLMRILRALIQFNSKHHFVTRVGGNPESKQRFQTHVMSDLVNDEPNSEQFIFRATAIFDVFIGGVTN